MTRHLNENVLVLLGLFLAAAGLYASTIGATYFGEGVAQSPMFFPRIILILWMGLAALGLIQALRTTAPGKPVASLWRVGILVIACVAYTNLIGREGFFLPSVVFAAICLPVFGIRSPWRVALYALAVPGALVLFFNHTLKMPLPVSRFSHLF